MSPEPNPHRREPEPEWSGPIWQHPYFLYVWITLGLFLFLIFIGFLALSQGWIPQR